ncbi:MAG: hypothetical protein GHHEDOFH_03049 [Pseudorhodoplanes sp.]|nr:hypothetical protein [Pseudorhodoplanes sp.]GIK80259.1 MAG: hypothetical protein BroJett024_13640 [Alphaproteobacteria bacterium]
MRSRTLFSFVPVCVASLVGFAATLHARPALMPDGAGRTVPARESAELAALDTFKPVREYFKTPAGKEDLKMLGDAVDLAIEYGWDKAPKRIGDAKTVLDFYSSDPSSPERWREFGLLAADTLLDKYYHVPFPARKALLWGLTRMIDSAFEHAEELLDKSDERLMEEAIRKHSRRRPVMKAAPEFGCIELCFGKVVSYAPAPPYRSSTVSGRTTPTVHYGPATRPAPHYTPPRYTPPPVSTAPGTRPPSSTISGPTPLPDRPSTITSPSPPRTPGATVSPSPPPRVPSPPVTVTPPRTPPIAAIPAPTAPTMREPSVTAPTAPPAREPSVSAPTAPPTHEPSVSAPTAPSASEPSAPPPTAGLSPGRTAPGSDVSAGPAPGGIRLNPAPTRSETSEDLVNLRRDILRGRNSAY